MEIRKLKEQKWVLVEIRDRILLIRNLLRLKAEQALQTICLKFDNDVGGRGGELEAIKKETKVALKKFEVWEETVARPQQAT